MYDFTILSTVAKALPPISTEFTREAYFQEQFCERLDYLNYCKKSSKM